MGHENNKGHSLSDNVYTIYLCRHRLQCLLLIKIRVPGDGEIRSIQVSETKRYSRGIGPFISTTRPHYLCVQNNKDFLPH